MNERTQCDGVVLERDTYRYSGRGPSGYTMHYRERRCRRMAVRDGKCWQHAPAPQAQPPRIEPGSQP